MKLKIHTPKVPNFIKVSAEGSEDGVYHTLTAFDDKELEEIVVQWREDLFKRREEQYTNPPVVTSA